MSSSQLIIKGSLLAITLLVFAEINPGVHFLGTEFIERWRFRRELRDFLLASQEQLEIPHICRQFLQFQDPRLKIQRAFPFNSKTLQIEKMWLDLKSLQRQVQKSDGTIYVVHKANLVMMIAPKNKAIGFKETATIPLSITTGPEDSFEIQDCASVSAF